MSRSWSAAFSAIKFGDGCSFFLFFFFLVLAGSKEPQAWNRLALTHIRQLYCMISIQHINVGSEDVTPEHRRVHLQWALLTTLRNGIPAGDPSLVILNIKGWWLSNKVLALTGLLDVWLVLIDNNELSLDELVRWETFWKDDVVRLGVWLMNR